MAITASQVTTSNTLEQFRQQFNNLQSDVRGLESGTISFSQITTTSSNTTTLNVREDGVIVFEGATDDANETTLTVVDPTADRTISLPNETGTVLLRTTTENSFITGQTSISSGDVDSGNDELLLSDAGSSVFKRVTVDNLISAASGLTAVSADTTPQLGGDLDTNNNDIVTVSDRNLNLLPNGDGKVIIDGNGSTAGVLISDGAIEIRSGTGSVSEIKFYCEVNNAHAQTLKAQPHSASSSAVLVLPVASGTLIGTGDTGSVSNSMLATINTAGKVTLASLEIDGGTDIGANLTTSDLIIVDDGAGGTNRKAALSRMVTLMAAELDDPTALAIALG
tara:strand:+ start:157 stop:1167 length:1011 start_codon:yes stop_codon:yes gene_type:complete